MVELSSSNVLFFVGIALMAIAVIAAIICVIVFNLMGSRLKEQLEQEYGKPWS